MSLSIEITFKNKDMAKSEVVTFVLLQKINAIN